MIAVAAVLVVAVLGVVSGADLGGFFSEQIDSVKNAVGGGE
jgi:hypothetical protein